MNDQDWNHDTQLDRLVDGELSPQEYRELLQALDGEPDGWRRAALAFLEAQAFGQDFAALRQEMNEPRKSASAPITPPGRDRGLVRLALAMAASFLVAFGLGAWWRSDFLRRDTPPVTSVIQDSSAQDSVAQDHPNSGAGTELAQAIVPAPNTSLPQSLLPRSNPQEQLTFVVASGDGQPERVDVPIYDQDDAYARWLIEQPLLPFEVERDLRQAGFRIERQRQWAPVRLRDGRRAVFPVDELQITPVSNHTY